MIPSARDYLTMWYQTWVNDLEKNLAKQADLQADEATLRELVGVCQMAFATLFPEPKEEVDPSPQPIVEEQPNGPDNGDTPPSDPTGPN